MPLLDPKKNELIAIFPPFFPIRIKYKDIFDMKEFYDALKEWLSDKEWKGYAGGIDPWNMYYGVEQWETYYTERIESGAKELWIRWRMARDAPGRSTITIKGKTHPKIRQFLDVDFHCLALAPTEVVRNGQKIKANKGEVEISIDAYIDPIAMKSLKTSPLLKLFYTLFTKRIYSIETTHWKKELYQECYELANFVKQWFKLKRYLPYEEVRTFYPSKAWPSHLREG